MNEVAEARWLWVGVVSATLIIPGGLVFGASARWGRRGAWLGLALGELWGCVALYGLFWMAMHCRHDCYRAPDPFTHIWSEDIADGVFQWGKVFVVLSPFHLAWAVIGGACAFVGLKRRGRRQETVSSTPSC